MNALSFADELFYRTFAPPDRAAATHQIDFLFRYLAHPYFNFHRSQKVRNLASIFNHILIRVAAVSKRSKISEIQNKTIF